MNLFTDMSSIQATENKDKSSNKIPPSGIQKSPTGLKGFDEITYGGIPKFRPTILVGSSGTGKTFMSLEYIINGVMMYNEPGVFMTFEEKTEELQENVRTLGYDLKKMVDEKKVFLEHLTINTNEVYEVGKYNIEGLFVRMERAIEKVKARRIVLDSFDTLFANFDSRMLRSEFKRLFNWLKDKKVTAIITAESGDTYITRLGLEENVADCVIELTNRVTNQIGIRRIRIIKYRGSFHANNEYPFVIDQNGMTIFPLIHQGMEQPSSKKRILSGISSLDNMMDSKGFYQGSSILVSGTAGTGKTSVMASFASSICENKQTCMFCAFEETPNQLLRNMESIGINLQPYITAGKLHFYYARPTLQNLELHFLAIKERIDQLKPSAIILDPITNLMTEGPYSDVRSMLTRFIDYLKTEQITVMFTAAITVGSITRSTSDEGISSMVDTWIMLQDFERSQKRGIYMYIMKSRGMNHSKEQREMKITTSGIEFIPASLWKQDHVAVK